MRVNYEVQYWTGEDPIRKPTLGVWQTFPGGAVRDGKGGTATLQLADQPVRGAVGADLDDGSRRTRATRTVPRTSAIAWATRFASFTWARRRRTENFTM